MNLRGTAFASDYDGTLCHSNWETGEERFDPAVLEAVRRYQEAGGLFGLCTGRPLFSVRQSLEGILEPDFYIVTTGAQVANAQGATLFQREIDRSVARALYERYASEEMAVLAVTSEDFFSIGRPFAPQMRTVASLDDVEGTLLGISLECHTSQARARAACEELNRDFGDVVEGFQNLGSVDVVARGCSKGSGVEVVRRTFGLECVVGIGDSFNDLPLLGAAEVSYTFCDSPQEVRDAATHVVGDLAEALAHFTATR